MNTLYRVNLSYGVPRQRVYRSEVRCMVTGATRKEAESRAIEWANSNPHGWQLTTGGAWRVDAISPVLQTPDTVPAIPM